MLSLKIKMAEHYDPLIPLPRYQTPDAAGADLAACLGVGEKWIIRPGERVLVPTGLFMEIPQGYEVQIRPRSGIALKTGLMILNSPGTIDSDYRGEVKIILGNLGIKDEVINHGDRIAQIVVAPIVQVTFVQVTELGHTKRGDQGFGSSGV
jgi:dUTP pyrophosphatase